MLGRDDAADEVGMDGDLAVAPVNQDRKLDGARPAVPQNRVESRADGAAGKDDVVNQEHVAALGTGGAGGKRGGLDLEVVPEAGDG